MSFNVDIYLSCNKLFTRSKNRAAVNSSEQHLSASLIKHIVLNNVNNNGSISIVNKIKYLSVTIIIERIWFIL